MGRGPEPSWRYTSSSNTKRPSTLLGSTMGTRNTLPSAAMRVRWRFTVRALTPTASARSAAPPPPVRFVAEGEVGAEARAYEIVDLEDAVEGLHLRERGVLRLVTGELEVMRLCCEAEVAQVRERPVAGDDTRLGHRGDALLDSVHARACSPGEARGPERVERSEE